MMAAIRAAACGCKVVLLEKNAFCGKKIGITGKGRCNLTNMKGWNEFSRHIHPSSAFVRNAFYNFSNQDLVSWLRQSGLETTVERGERVFPASMRATDVSRHLTRVLEETGVETICDCEVQSVRKTGGIFTILCTRSGALIASDEVTARAVIIATGGLSYPSTGSSGRGFDIARDFDIEVTPTFPSLTALTPSGYDRELEGIDLVNVGLILFVDRDPVQIDQGDLSFTDGGIEGPLGFRFSRKAVKAILSGSRVEVELDLKPALNLQTLTRRIGREIDALGFDPKDMGSVKMRTLLKKLMPERLIRPFLKANPGLTAEKLPFALKSWRMRIVSYVGYERAVVTSGGVSQKEIVPKTMCSRKVSGLYFAGEVLDIDGDTGGYNLQCAFSTGALAGDRAAQNILKEKGASESL